MAPNGNTSDLQQINQEIYKRNYELSVVNKTLSLLRKLYQISQQALNPVSLSEKISDAVRVDLNMEAAGVFLFTPEDNSLSPLKFSVSRRFSEAMGKDKSKLLSQRIVVAKGSALNRVVYGRVPNTTSKLEDLWGSNFSATRLQKISADSRLQTILLYPLAAQDRVIGLIIFALNRNFKTLSTYEQEAIKSLIDVVSVALNNALLYEKLEATNKQLVVLDKARAEFISIASHQLRTPPATIKWYLAAVLAGDFGKISPKVKSALGKSQLTNNNLISLIDDMLNVSRIERGKMEFLFERADAKKLTDETIVQLTPAALMKNLKLVYKKPKTKLPQILADKEKLQQVINNLVDNAIKYTKTGKITVELSKSSNELIWKVKDTGKGLTPDEKKSIFEKYGRGKNSQKQASGLGLGLYVAKVVVEHHKGKIWAESAGADKGTTFIVSLPLKTDLKAETFDLTKNQLS